MQLVPQWAPNIHPLIIHFPVALLLIAILADLGYLLFKRESWLSKTAVSLYALGAGGAIIAYFTGKQAGDGVTLPPAAYPIISEHADLALYATIFFSIYALVRVLLYWKKWDTKRWAAGLLLLIAAVGYGLVQQTAERGAMLVFKYGVGTTAAAADSVSGPQAVTESPDIIISDNGSWRWQSDASLFKQFQLLTGEPDAVRMQASADGNALTLNVLSPEPFLLTFGPQLANVQLAARVNLDNFKGRFLLVHHVKTPSTYGFFAIENTRAELGQVENAKVRSFDSGKIATQGWTTLKAVSSSGHYRGYVDDKLVVHGHGSDLEAGTTGFAFSGTGSIQLANLDVTSLDEAPMMNMEQGHMQQKKMSHEESGEKHSH